MSVRSRLMGQGQHMTERIAGAPVRAIDEGLNLVDKGLVRGGKAIRADRAAKAVAKTAVRKDKHGQNFGNGYTGFQEGGGMIGAAAVGGGLYAWGGSNYQIHMPEKAGETSYTGTAEIHNYDGVSSAPTLGASGDMVLGMHKGRKG